MTIPQWFERELSAIDPDLFVVWNEDKGRFQVRLWKHPFVRKDWKKNSNVYLTVCYEDENFYDVGFKPLDQRTLHAVRVSRKQAENPLAALREIDAWNDRMDEQFDAELDYMLKDACKNTWRHLHEPLVDLGAK